jgi:hypothetical protein
VIWFSTVGTGLIQAGVGALVAATGLSTASIGRPGYTWTSPVVVTYRGPGGGDSALSTTPNPFLFAASGLVTGVLILIAFVAEAKTPTPFPPFSQANFAASQTDLALWSFRSFAWGLFAVAAIPFFTLVGRLFRHRNADAASIATLLSVIGATLYVLRAILQDSALAKVGTLAAPSPTEATYQATLLFAMANPLLPLGGAIWGLGFILFGALTWSSGILPKWMAVVAIVGGVAGWALFPVLNSSGQFFGYVITEVLVPITTAIWCFACAMIFLRRGRATARTDQARDPAG